MYKVNINLMFHFVLNSFKYFKCILYIIITKVYFELALKHLQDMIMENTVHDLLKLVFIVVRLWVIFIYLGFIHFIFGY